MNLDTEVLGQFTEENAFAGLGQKIQCGEPGASWKVRALDGVYKSSSGLRRARERRGGHPGHSWKGDGQHPQ